MPDDAGEADSEEQVEVSASLPAERLEELRRAVGSHNMTRLRQQLAALDDRDPAQRQLAARLQELSRKYDFAGLAATLESVEVEERS